MQQLEAAASRAREEGRADESFLYLQASLMYRYATRFRLFQPSTDWEIESQRLEHAAESYSKAAYCLEQIVTSLQRAQLLIARLPARLEHLFSSSAVFSLLDNLTIYAQGIASSLNLRTNTSPENTLMITNNLAELSFREEGSMSNYVTLLNDALLLPQSPEMTSLLQLHKGLFEQAQIYLQDAKNIENSLIRL